MAFTYTLKDLTVIDGAATKAIVRGVDGTDIQDIEFAGTGLNDVTSRGSLQTVIDDAKTALSAIGDLIALDKTDFTLKNEISTQNDPPTVVVTTRWIF